MTDREDMLRRLLAAELADDWQPHSVDLSRLSYREGQQLKSGLDAAFIEEKLAEAQRGRKRASITFGVALPLLILLPFTFFEAAGDWAAYLNALLLAAPLAVGLTAVIRHMHWRKREMIYRAFRLMHGEHEPADLQKEPAITA